MALSIRKRGLFVALLVSVILLLLGSGSWAQPPFGDRLNSFTTERYLIGLNLGFGSPAHVAAINYVNAIKPAGTPWFPLPFGYVMLHERDNYRDSDGNILGNGRALSANLFLLLINADGPYPPYVTLFSVAAFSTNQDILEYLANEGLMEPGTASNIKFKHEVEREEASGKVNSYFKVSHPDGSTINFNTEWTEPDPTHFPASLGTEDLVAVIPYRYLRFAYAPDWVFIYPQQSETCELIAPGGTPQTDVSFELDINLENDLGDIFNGLTEADVYGFNFAHYIQVTEKIYP